MPIYEIPVGPPGTLPALVTGQELSGMSAETQASAREIQSYGVSGPSQLRTDIDIRPLQYRKFDVRLPTVSQKLSRAVSTLSKLTPAGMVKTQLTPLQEEAKRRFEEQAEEIKAKLREEAEKKIEKFKESKAFEKIQEADVEIEKGAKILSEKLPSIGGYPLLDIPIVSSEQIKRIIEPGIKEELKKVKEREDVLYEPVEEQFQREFITKAEEGIEVEGIKRDIPTKLEIDQDVANLRQSWEEFAQTNFDKAAENLARKKGEGAATQEDYDKLADYWTKRAEKGLESEVKAYERTYEDEAKILMKGFLETPAGRQWQSNFEAVRASVEPWGLDIKRKLLMGASAYAGTSPLQEIGISTAVGAAGLGIASLGPAYVAAAKTTVGKAATFGISAYMTKGLLPPADIKIGFGDSKQISLRTGEVWRKDIPKTQRVLAGAYAALGVVGVGTGITKSFRIKTLPAKVHEPGLWEAKLKKQWVWKLEGGEVVPFKQKFTVLPSGLRQVGITQRRFREFAPFGKKIFGWELKPTAMFFEPTARGTVSLVGGKPLLQYTAKIKPYKGAWPKEISAKFKPMERRFFKRVGKGLGFVETKAELMVKSPTGKMVKRSEAMFVKWKTDWQVGGRPKKWFDFGVSKFVKVGEFPPKKGDVAGLIKTRYDWLKTGVKPKPAKFYEVATISGKARQEIIPTRLFETFGVRKTTTVTGKPIYDIGKRFGLGGADIPTKKAAWIFTRKTPFTGKGFKKSLSLLRVETSKKAVEFRGPKVRIDRISKPTGKVISYDWLKPTVKVKPVKVITKPTIKVKPYKATGVIARVGSGLEQIQKPKGIEIEQQFISSVLGRQLSDKLWGMAKAVPFGVKDSQIGLFTPLIVPVSPKTRLEIVPTLATSLQPRLDSKLQSRLTSRLTSRLQPRIATRLQPRLGIRIQPKLSTRISTRLKARLTTRLKTRLGVRLQPPGITTEIKITPKVPPPGILFPDNDIIKKKRIAKGKKVAKAFQLYVKRYGEWKAFGKPTVKGKALMKGVKFAKGTLGVSFKVLPTKKLIRARDISFKVSEKVFRKPIKLGKEIKGSPIFIQRGGKDVTFVKSGRIASLGERREIQMLRRKSKINYMGG